MYLGNENIRLVTMNKDGSAEILFKNQTYMDIPKEKVDNKTLTKENILEELIEMIRDAHNLDEHAVVFALENFREYLLEEFNG